jgi:hypothetical protein
VLLCSFVVCRLDDGFDFGQLYRVSVVCFEIGYTVV